MQQGEYVGNVGFAVGTEIYKRSHSYKEQEKSRIPSEQYRMRAYKADRFKVDQRYRSCIFFPFCYEQQHADIKQHAAYIIKAGNCELQHSHHHRVYSMQDDTKTC